MSAEACAFGEYEQGRVYLIGREVARGRNLETANVEDGHRDKSLQWFG